MQPLADGKTKELGGRGKRQTLCSLWAVQCISAFQDPEIQTSCFAACDVCCAPEFRDTGRFATALSGAPGREAAGMEGCQPSLLAHPPFLLLVTPDIHNLTVCCGHTARIPGGLWA